MKENHNNSLPRVVLFFWHVGWAILCLGYLIIATPIVILWLVAARLDELLASLKNWVESLYPPE